MIRNIFLIFAGFLPLAAVQIFASDSIAGLGYRLHEGALIERDGSNIVVSIGGRRYEITPQGMDLRDYAHQNYLGDKEQFPLAIVFCENDCSLCFFHAAEVDHRGIAARSCLRVPLSGELPGFITLASMSFGGAKILITKDMKLRLGDQEILPPTAPSKRPARKKSKKFSKPKS